MPQRTNDFQKLVELTHRLFAPQNAIVTASAMVESASGQKREIDIFIEFETELYPVLIAVEAKDLSRPIETTTLEQYIGKYNSRDGIKVDKVIIVAKAFARTVADRAHSLGFQLHTLTSLETSGVGEFSKPQQGQPGGWWVGKDLEKKVNLSLFDNASNQLNDAYLAGRIMQRKAHVNLGSPLLWVGSILESYLGDNATQLYEEHAGETLHFIVEIGFTDHTIEANGFRAVRLRKIILDFGEKMKIPDMQSEFSKLTTWPSKTKTIVHEKGDGKNSKVSIVYEDTGALPSKLYLHAEPLDGGEQIIKKVVLTIDSSEINALTVGNLISEASNSW